MLQYESMNYTQVYNYKKRMLRKMGNLTNAQKSIWVTEQYYRGSSINNICGSAVIQEEVDFDKLEESIKLVCKKHDNFWLEFKLVDGEVKQVLSERKKIHPCGNVRRSF